IFLAGKAVCYRILAFFCYGKLHFKCESADLAFKADMIFVSCMPQNVGLRCGCFLITALLNTDIRLAGGDKVFSGIASNLKGRLKT
uniref:hypothetical protein n=2 Tax=Neisseria mucosa TaxID=488 RepID=UPI00280AFD55